MFGTVTAYASARGRLRARWALDLTIMLPFVLPGLVVGVAYLTAFNSGPLVLTGTATILVLAYFTRRVAFVFRSVAAAIAQIDPKLEDASKICGAGWGDDDAPRDGAARRAGDAGGRDPRVLDADRRDQRDGAALFGAAGRRSRSRSTSSCSATSSPRRSAIGTITTVMTLLLVLAASRLAGKNMADLFR